MDKTLQYDNNRIKHLTAQVLSGHCEESAENVV